MQLDRIVRRDPDTMGGTPAAETVRAGSSSPEGRRPSKMRLTCPPGPGDEIPDYQAMARRAGSGPVCAHSARAVCNGRAMASAGTGAPSIPGFARTPQRAGRSFLVAAD